MRDICNYIEKSYKVTKDNGSTTNNKDWNKNTFYQKYHKVPNMVMCAFNCSTETKANRSVSSRPPGLHSKFQVRQILSQKQVNMPNQLFFLGAILSYICYLVWILHTDIVKLINKNYAVLYLLLFFSIYFFYLLFSIYWVIIIYSIYYFYISYRVLTVFHSIF